VNRKVSVIIVALLALAAVEFVAIGVDAAGLGRGGGSAPPPAARRQQTPVAVATPTAPGCAPGDEAACGPAGVQIAADPLVIDCDGSHASRVTVRLFDAAGAPVADGTFVAAHAYNGDVTPGKTSTVGGAAEFNVRFYSDLFPPGPNVIVDSGAFEAGIRVRCVPNSQCPLSPPASVSPPCSTPTPFPCIPSPGSGPMSPPCVVPPPPPVCEHPGNRPESPPCVPLSPPSCPDNGFRPPEPRCGPPSPPWCPDRSGPPCGGPLSPPRCQSATNPQCAAPTPVPPSSPPPLPCGATSPSPPCAVLLEVHIDCDVSAPGTQDRCNVSAGATSWDIGVVVSNRSGVDSTIGSFNFDMHDSDTSRLVPVAGIDDNLDANPDFNQAELTNGAWQCNPPAPSPDLGTDGPGRAVSRLVCYVPGGTPTTIADGQDLTIAVVHYAVPGGALSGDVTLDLGYVEVTDQTFTRTAGCEIGDLPPFNAACDAVRVTLNSP
jgi:hypothetical protein